MSTLDYSSQFISAGRLAIKSQWRSSDISGSPKTKADIVHSLKQKALRIKRFVNRELSTVNCRSGFSFVELLVVITIMGILISIATASYSNFQRSTNLKNAALQLKSDLRLVQNKALAGDKSSDKCKLITNPRPVLVGWYMTVNDESSSYAFNSVCLNSIGIEDPDSPVVKTLELPKGVKVTSVGGSGISGAQILFRPLTSGASVHSTSSPPFLNAAGDLINQISNGLPFEITLTSDSGENYQVIIQPSGEISEKKL